jgi:hypothetical protein
MNAEKDLLWVVFRMTLYGKRDSQNAVCSQAEWEEMERGWPGRHTLLRAGFTNEQDAERLARGTSGDSHVRGSREKPIVELLQARAAGVAALARGNGLPVR